MTIKRYSSMTKSNYQPVPSNQSFSGNIISSAVTGLGLGAGSEIGHRIVGSFFNNEVQSKTKTIPSQEHKCETIKNLLKTCQENTNNDCSYLFNQLLENNCSL